MTKKIYSFRASQDKEIYREIEIYGDATLSNLAEAILQSFDFDNDHAFGFYSDMKNTYNSKEKYELFADMGDADEGVEGVENTRIDSVFTPRKKMLFFFDYGDSWDFIVKCICMSKEEKGKKYPRVVLSKGDAMEQYPEYEEAV